jgi:glycosyltransferase involved in cell wall biosynthesis
MSLEIVKAAQDWPEGWVLVLHGNSTPSTPQEQRFLHRLREADRKRRTVFSLDPLPHKEFEELVASADIGLVLYKKTSENMYQLGLSSGKLAQYLKCGLPVVVSDFPSLRSIVDGYRCGICVQNLEEMKRVIEEIFADYKEYSNRSIQCFNDLFSLDNYSPSILAIVRILINSG